MERRNWCWDVIGALTLLTLLECQWLAELGEGSEIKAARLKSGRYKGGLFEVSVAKDGEMMRDVASDDESESAHGEGFAVRDTVSRPGSGRQILEQANRGKADKAELLDVIEPRNSIGLGTLRADVLVEKPGRGASNPRANQSARNAKARSVSVT